MTMGDATSRKLLWDTYGRPEQVNAEVALAALGITDVDPKSVVAFQYGNREAADAYALANLENYGHPTLGTYSLDPAGIVGVVDLRPAIADMKRRYEEEIARTQQPEV